MAQDQVEEIKRRIDIVELISEYVELKKAGKNYKALCPFHSEKTSSFIVSPQLQIFKCFGCGVGGDVYKFLMEYEKIDFPQALKNLAQRVGVKLEPPKGSRTQEKEQLYEINKLTLNVYSYLLNKHPIGSLAREYLAKRGIKKEAIETFELGFAPDKPSTIYKFLKEKKGFPETLLEKAGLVVKNQNLYSDGTNSAYFDRFRGRIIFPLYDHFGSVIGFAGRILKTQGEVAKYINIPETLIYKKSQTLYGLNLTKQEIKKEKKAVIVEGELDLISSWQAGVKNVVAIKGSALTQDQISLISRFSDTIILALDSDLAGDLAARRGVEEALKQGLEVKVANLGKFKDPDEIAQSSPELWKKSISESPGVYDFFIESIFKRFDPETPEGKAKISKSITPILLDIEDEIIKAHYVKKVAQSLNVPEEAVIKELEKREQKVQTRFSGEITKPREDSRRNLLEKYLLTLIFQARPDQISDPELDDLIKSQAAKRLLEEYKLWLVKSKDEKFDPVAFTQNLPGELVDLFATLILSDIQRLMEENDIDKEIAGAKKSLSILDAKEEIGKLTQAIKQLENLGKTGEVIYLETKLGKISAKLARLETSYD